MISFSGQPLTCTRWSGDALLSAPEVQKSRISCHLRGLACFCLLSDNQQGFRSQCRASFERYGGSVRSMTSDAVHLVGRFVASRHRTAPVTSGCGSP